MKNYKRFIKSVISLLLILSMIIPPFPTIKVESKASVVADIEKSIIKGDIDNDGEITSIDLVLLRMHLLGNKTLTGDSLEAADYNLDGSVDSQQVMSVIGTPIIRADLLKL